MAKPYTRFFANECAWCSQPATREVVGRNGKSVGKFCRAHADQQVLDLLTPEERGELDEAG